MKTLKRKKRPLYPKNQWIGWRWLKMTKFFGNRNDEVGEKCEWIDEKHNEAASHPLNNTICQYRTHFRATTTILLNLLWRLYGANRACTCWTLHLLDSAIPGIHTSLSLMPKHKFWFDILPPGRPSLRVVLLSTLRHTRTHTHWRLRYVARRKTTSA